MSAVVAKPKGVYATNHNASKKYLHRQMQSIVILLPSFHLASRCGYADYLLQPACVTVLKSERFSDMLPQIRCPRHNSHVIQYFLSSEIDGKKECKSRRSLQTMIFAYNRFKQMLLINNRSESLEILQTYHSICCLRLFPFVNFQYLSLQVCCNLNTCH